MLTIDSLEFSPKDENDPDQKTICKFNFEACGILFYNWKIRCKDERHYSICPPYVKHFEKKSNIIQFVDKEDFLNLARTVIQAGIEKGLLKRLNNSNRRQAEYESRY